MRKAPPPVGVNITLTPASSAFSGPRRFSAWPARIITLQKLRIAPPASFSITDWTVFIIFNVVIGGIGSIEGPILGTIIYFVLRQYLADLGAWHLIILGTFRSSIILVERRGLWGLIRRALARRSHPDRAQAVSHVQFWAKSAADADQALNWS